MVQRFKESVGISKGSYDETIAQCTCRVFSLRRFQDPEIGSAFVFANRLPLLVDFCCVLLPAVPVAMTKLNSLDDKISKLSSMMLHTIEKLDKGAYVRTTAASRAGNGLTWFGVAWTAAHAGQLAIMEAVCDLPVDLPGAAPAELESYRSITENLEKAMPERLVRGVSGTSP
jgi:hypothetical protein